MVKCCMRNCYNTEVEDLYDILKELLPLWLMNILLDLSKCANSQTQKNGLANFNILNIYSIHKLMAEVDRMDRNGDYFDKSNPKKIFDDKLLEILREFDYLLCNGGLPSAEELNKRYNPNDNLYPEDIEGTDDEEKLNDILDNNNNLNDWKNDDKDSDSDKNIFIEDDGSDSNNSNTGDNNDNNGFNDSQNGSDGDDGSDNGSNNDSSSSDSDGGTGSSGNLNNNNTDNNSNNDGSGNDSNNGKDGKDGLNDGSNDKDKSGSNDNKGIDFGNPIKNIPNDELKNLDTTKTYFKCFVPKFDLKTYVNTPAPNEPPIVLTPKRIANIKRLHYEILLPIFNFYYGPEAPPTCQLHVVYGIGSHYMSMLFGGNIFSQHMKGEAVDFTMVGVKYEQLLKDLKEGNLKIPFGVLARTNGIHITLPFTFEGFEVKGMVLDSPESGLGSLTIDYIIN